MTTRRLATMVAAVIGAAALAGCGAPDAPLPPVPALVEVTMSDHRFDYDAGSIPRGRVIFRARNAGSRPHHMTLVFIPEDFAPLEERLSDGRQQVVDALARTSVRPPGSVDTLAVNLSPGRWALMCYVVEADDRSHASMGMASEFRVQ